MTSFTVADRYCLIALVLVLFVIAILIYINGTYRHVEYINAQDVLKVGKSGDLLLWASEVRPLFTASMASAVFGAHWTHSAILYIDPKTNTPYAWESNFFKSMRFRDRLSGEKRKSGPQLVPLHDKINNYAGFCALCKISPSLEEVLGGPQKVEERFQYIFQVCSPLSFNFSRRWPFFALMTDWVRIDPNSSLALSLRRKWCKSDSMLCSELTFYTYYLLGAWDDDESFSSCTSNDRHPLMYLPYNFAESGRLGRYKIAYHVQLRPPSRQRRK